MESLGLLITLTLGGLGMFLVVLVVTFVLAKVLVLHTYSYKTLIRCLTQETGALEKKLTYLRQPPCSLSLSKAL